MKRNRVTKVMSYVLATAMLIGGFSLSPLATVEVRAATTKNMNLNVNNSIAGIDSPSKTVTDKWTGSKVYIGNKLWRVLDPTKASTGASGYAFLFSEDMLMNLRVYHNSAEHITWAECQLRKDLNGADANSNNGGLYTTVFTTASEKDSIAALTIPNPDHGSIDGGDDTTDKLFLLSSEEAVSENYGFSNSQAPSPTRSATNGNDLTSMWWLRSPGNTQGRAAFVGENGYVNGDGTDVNTNTCTSNDDHKTYNISARPAFNLDLSKVLFTSASGMSKSSSFAATSNSSATSWKLTLHAGDDFVATRKDGETGNVDAGADLHVNVTNAGTSSDSSVTFDQISAMLVAEDGTVAAYGKINSTSTLTGEHTVTIPTGIANGNYNLKVFGEKVNSTSTSNLTDYATNMVSIPVTVVNSAYIATASTGSTGENNSGKTEAPTNLITNNYTTGGLVSKCVIDEQGPACKAAFKAATPTGYKEAFSFNMLLKEGGAFQIGATKKTGEFVINIPKEHRKAGRTFAIIGIDKFGKTKIFKDTDASDESITITLDLEGYAFSVIYTDTGADINSGNNADSGTYTVKKGDTLSKIAKRLGISKKSLIEKNKLSNPNKLKINQKIEY